MSTLYLTEKCKDAWHEYNKIKDINLLDKCINFIKSEYSENNLFGDNCVVKVRRATEYYNKTYDEENVVKLLRRVEELADTDNKLKHEIKNNLKKMFNLNRKTAQGLCDCVSISLYINMISSDVGRYEYDIGKLLMYLCSINASIFTIKHNTDYIVRIYFEIGTLQFIFDFINDRLPKSAAYKLPNVQRDITKIREQLRKLINEIFLCNIVEPHILMCNLRMNDPDYVVGKLRLYRYSGFTDLTVRINVAREADGSVSLLDCHNLNLLSSGDYILYNSTITTDPYYWNPRYFNGCWVDIYDNYNKKYNNTSVTLDTELLVNKITNYYSPAKERNIVDIGNKHGVLFSDDRFSLNLKNFISPMWAGMISFCYQLNEDRLIEKSEKIKKVIDNITNDRLELKKKMVEIDNYMENLNKYLVDINYFKNPKYDLLVENKFILKDIGNESAKKIILDDLFKIPDKLKIDSYSRRKIQDRLKEAETKYVNQQIKRELSQEYQQILIDLDNGGISPVGLLTSEKINNASEEIKKTLVYKMSIALQKEKEITECYKSTPEYLLLVKKEKELIVNVINDFIELGTLNKKFYKNLEEYYNADNKLKGMNAQLLKIKTDLHRIDIGFDEILLYEYFKKIIVFYPNKYYVSKLLLLNNISFSFGYIQRIIDVKLFYKYIYDELDIKNKKYIDDIQIKYSLCKDAEIENLNGIIDQIDKKNYVDSIEIQKKIIAAKFGSMIKYDSVIDVRPYFNTYLYKDYIEETDIFKNYYKSITGTDYIENNRSDIAYDIVGGYNNISADNYFNKYMKYKSKYLQKKFNRNNFIK